MTISMESSGSPIWKLVDQFNRVAVCESGHKLLVGRDRCDLTLKSKSVEPRHAIVQFDENSKCLAVKDLATQNGTFVNDSRIPRQSTVHLAQGDRIRFGYDSVVYQVAVDLGSGDETPTPAPAFPATRPGPPGAAAAEPVRLLQPRWPSDARRGSDGGSTVFSNGHENGSPVHARSRRRSVQDEEEEEKNSNSGATEGSESMDTPPSAVLSNNNSPAAAKEELGAQVEEEKESEEEKAQVEVLEKDQEEVEPVEAKPTLTSKPSQAFIIDFDALPTSPASPDAQTTPTMASKLTESPLAKEEPKEKEKEAEGEQQPLSSLLPDRLRRSIQEREERKAAKLQEAREAKEKEKEKERLNGSAKNSGPPAFTDSRRRSTSNSRPGQRPSSTTRTRQRSVSKGRNGSVDRPAEKDASAANPFRPGVSNRSTPQAGRQSAAESRKSRMDKASPRERMVVKRSPSTENSIVSSQSIVTTLKSYKDPKNYLFERMINSPNQSTALVGPRMGELDPNAQKKNRQADLKVRKVPADNNVHLKSEIEALDSPDGNKEDADSTPSETGTYTIENEKAQKAKDELKISLPGDYNAEEARNSSDLSEQLTDTSVPLNEAFVAIERLAQQARDDADSEVQSAVDSKRRNTGGHNGDLLYNVLRPSNRSTRRTPSEHGSDAEHSPTTTSRSGAAGGRGQAKRPRDGSAVRRSNSENHKMNKTFQLRRNNALANSETETGRGRTAATSTAGVPTATASASRRRMSTGTSSVSSSEVPPAMTMSNYEVPSSSRKGSNTSTAHKPNLVRFDYGRHSLKTSSQSASSTAAQKSPRLQQQQLQHQKKAEALARRKNYDPRRAAAESKSARRGNSIGSESEGPAASDQSRPRRTSSADARPVTEMETPPASVPRVTHGNHPTRRTGATAVRRHESLNTGSSGKPMRPVRAGAAVVPNSNSLLGPNAPASAFLDVRSPMEQRSQSVSNAEPSCCSEVAYDLLLVSSIHVMTLKLRRGFDDLLQKLRDQRVLTRTPTPIDELFQSKPPAHLNSTNSELKEVLANLRAIECRYQTLDTHLLPSNPSGAISARTTTLGSCTETEYQQEVSRIASELHGFFPISNVDDELDAAREVQFSQPAPYDGPGNVLHPIARPAPVNPHSQDDQPRRLESSF